MYVLLPSSVPFFMSVFIRLLSPRTVASVTTDILPRNALSSEDNAKTKAFFTVLTLLLPSTFPQPFKAEWIPTTFSNSTFCPHSVFMCFVWISEQRAIIYLYNIN
jgi:hypothetical protein